MRKPQSNITRGTPGMILLAFAVLLLTTALVRHLQSRQNPIPDEIQHLTGLGDASLYTTSLSGNDFYNPALVFDAAPKGLFRRSVNAVPRADSHMLRHGLDSTGRFVVYTTDSRSNTPATHPAPRWFLKSGPNLYVEFGDRKHWPAFKATP